MQQLISKLGEMPLRTDYGEVTFSAWYDGKSEVYSVHTGLPKGDEPLPVRLHSSCVTAHYFQSRDCDCREQFDMALKRICEDGIGMIIVLDHQAKDNGIMATLAENNLPGGKRNSSDAFEALGFPRDNRSYFSGALILKKLGVRKVDLISNNKKKLAALVENGIEVVKRSSVVVDMEVRPDLRAHLEGKKESEGHEI